MFDSRMTRRGFAAAAATGAATIGLLGGSVNSASAYQGNMERALGSLHQALGELRQATANKGGHRARAMELVNQAIAETQAGVELLTSTAAVSVLRADAAIPTTSGRQFLRATI